MAAKDYFLHPPDPSGQIHQQLSNVDSFLLAQAALKSKNPPEWNVLSGIRYFAGFTGCSYSTARRLIKTCKVPAYKIGNVYFFLIAEVIQAINEYPEIARFNWLSYEDNQHSEDEMIIHWRKYRYPDHILVKFTFQRQTLSAVLPANLWTRNYRIGNILIKLVNKHLKSLTNEKK